MVEVALAMLQRPDGEARIICVGCTMRLIELGMVELVDTAPINDFQPAFVSAVYKITPPHTLGECRAAIADRHVGPPEWGD
jgi:hypothetical protein